MDQKRDNKIVSKRGSTWVRMNPCVDVVVVVVPSYGDLHPAPASLATVIPAATKQA